MTALPEFWNVGARKWPTVICTTWQHKMPTDKLEPTNGRMENKKKKFETITFCLHLEFKWQSIKHISPWLMVWAKDNEYYWSWTFAIIVNDREYSATMVKSKKNAITNVQRIFIIKPFTVHFYSKIVCSNFYSKIIQMDFYKINYKALLF